MNGFTITGRLERPTASTRAPRASPSPEPIPVEGAPAAKPAPAVARAARNLALAHLIERLIERGELRDYAHAAKQLGITRARVTQIINLLYLPVAEQEALLLGRSAATERQLRRASFTARPN